MSFSQFEPGGVSFHVLNVKQRATKGSPYKRKEEGEGEGEEGFPFINSYMEFTLKVMLHLYNNTHLDHQHNPSVERSMHISISIP